MIGMLSVFSVTYFTLCQSGVGGGGGGGGGGQKAWFGNGRQPPAGEKGKKIQKQLGRQEGNGGNFTTPEF